MSDTLRKIDVHVHSQCYPDISLPRPDGSNFASPEQVLSMYDSWGIEYGVLQPAFSNECCYAAFTNEEACMVSRKYPKRFFWFCDLSPRMGENGPATDFDAIVNHYKSIGAKGVGELCYNLPFDDPLSEKLLAACA